MMLKSAQANLKTNIYLLNDVQKFPRQSQNMKNDEVEKEKKALKILFEEKDATLCTS